MNVIAVSCNPSGKIGLAVNSLHLSTGQYFQDICIVFADALSIRCIIGQMHYLSDALSVRYIIFQMLYLLDDLFQMHYTFIAFYVNII